MLLTKIRIFSKSTRSLNNSHSPKLVYLRNKNLRDFIGQTTIKNNKVQKGKELKPGKCRPCLTSIKETCVVDRLHQHHLSRPFRQAKISKSTITQLVGSKNIIYLMECRKCKTQYVGKSETAFNIRLNDHRSSA